MSLRPPDLKALAKKVNEEMADLYSQRYQMRMLGLRPFSVYGEDEMSKGKYANVVSLFAWAMSAGRSPILWGDGTQTRDFIHADDVARAFVMAVESSLRTQVLNVGTGVETSFNDVIALLAEKLGVEPSPLYVATPIDIYAKRLLADVSGCENALGFRSEVSLEDGADRVLVRARAVLDSGEWQGLDAAQSGSGPRRR
jgi:UDP-glucose 4-epimerase